MARKRYKDVGSGSFFGQWVYEQIVPRTHFLVQLNRVIDWDVFNDMLIGAYRGHGERGRPPYPPVVLLKMLVIAYMYDLSERQVEETSNYHMAVKEFVGLGVTERAPDHSTLSDFRTRVKEATGWDLFEAISDEVLRQCRDAGIKLGTIQAVDGVHSVADVDNDADRRRQEQGQPPRDRQARVVNKGKRRQTGPDGKVKTMQVKYLGYKSSVSLNTETGLITSVKPTVGSAAENKQVPDLLEHDRHLGVDAQIYAGDRAYDDTDLHFRLHYHGQHSAFRLNDYRTRDSNKHAEFWKKIQESPEYQAGEAERYKIERKFGEAKRWHGFGRCRYIGLLNYGIQAFVTALVLNLKRIVLLLTGVPCRGSTRPSFHIAMR